MEQVKQFSNGGFVIHKVTISGYVGTFSAWYDKDGALIDAEQLRQMPYGRSSHNIRADSFARRYLEMIGRIQHSRFSPPVESVIDLHQLPDRWDMCD